MPILRTWLVMMLHELNRKMTRIFGLYTCDLASNTTF